MNIETSELLISIIHCSGLIPERIKYLHSLTSVVYTFREFYWK